MCEWTPPVETNPRRWTAPVTLLRPPERPDERIVREQRAVLDGAADPHEVLEQDPSRADRQVPTSEFPICPSGRPTAAPDAASCVVG